MDDKYLRHTKLQACPRSEWPRLSNTWKVLIACFVSIVLIGTALLYLAVTGDAFMNLPTSHTNNEGPSVDLLRRWGGFDERPFDDKCYRQERTAMLLSLFLGIIGIDQFYAHHWPLAVFKMLSGLSLWLGIGISIISDNPIAMILGSLVSSWSILWWLADIILWIVGGVYGTPGCPGGSSDGWRY
jgi:hypothetical protein